MPARTARPGTSTRVVEAVTKVGVALVILAAVPALRSVGLAAPPPPTPVPPSGSPSPFPTALRTPPPGPIAPRLTSPSAIVEDIDTGQVLYAKGANRPRPVASLTKVMTALVVLEDASPAETVVVSARAAGARGSQLGLVVGERISVDQLLYALLMQSSNDAAVALAEHVGGSVEAFIGRMNRKAERMGLRGTRFRDPAGLEDQGRSTARDLAVIVRAAYRQPLFGRITQTKFHRIAAPSGRTRRIQNRNVLLWLYPGAIGVKTGFTTPAQHCLIAAADRGGARLVVVALGSPGDDAAGVFTDGAALLNFGYEAFQKVALVARGQSLGRAMVEGRPVEVVAQVELSRFVRRDQAAAISRSLVVDGGLVLPVVAGQRVGEEVVFVGGKRVGAIEATAAATVWRSPTTPTAGPGANGEVSSLLESLRVITAMLRSLFGAFL
jgi:serine-type D-Ala-D-Ala carboxypeptidase (penicillin-binding protein 5/6)